MDKKFGWCFIGTGMISNVVSKHLNKYSSEMYIASIWNRTSKKAVSFSKKNKCKQYDKLEDAINDLNVDAVYIALNHHVHYEYLKRIIMCHKPILCEKPFTLNSKETKEVIELAKKENVFISEAMWTWHNEPALKAKEWLSKIGDIKKVDIVYSNPFMYILPLKRLNRLDLGGGALLDSGVYPITYAYRLFGYPKNIKVNSYEFKNGVDRKENITFSYDKFDVNIECNLIGKFNEVATIVGTKGKIVVPTFHSSNKAILYLDKTTISFMAKHSGYYPEFIHTKEDVLKGAKESSYVSFESTYNVMKIMDEIRKQINLVYPNELK